MCLCPYISSDRLKDDSNQLILNAPISWCFDTQICVLFFISTITKCWKQKKKGRKMKKKGKDHVRERSKKYDCPKESCRCYMKRERLEVVAY